MDSAIVISPDLSTIVYAGVQLAQNSRVPSTEIRMRHLAAHRTAQQSGRLALVISERRETGTLYLDTYPMRDLDRVSIVLGKAPLVLVMLEKLACGLKDQAKLLSIHEYEKTVSDPEVVEVFAKIRVRSVGNARAKTTTRGLQCSSLRLTAEFG